MMLKYELRMVGLRMFLREIPSLACAATGSNWEFM